MVYFVPDTGGGRLARHPNIVGALRSLKRRGASGSLSKVSIDLRTRDDIGNIAALAEVLARRLKTPGGLAYVSVKPEKSAGSTFRLANFPHLKDFAEALKPEGSGKINIAKVQAAVDELREAG